ncbi:GPO family capsid scaffolding protein [Sphingomonas psychrotolerans]|uniref:GPO family capsid scaffolding protein n=1 Tax=Sphingomonas psychrotolerans TaxID=1327635 RepID=A0ABU3N160_9SPHN|nr:GPO family capsid scaffolding protein [Sphingomonas psychrotolerans]MDT8758227.1 GPO family capsid scaffolding protein [Sphingomonas psychrotolerans]
MKTKPFLLATAGSTVDGRVIDDKMLEEMASSYDPKTYGARLNIEHIRGISGDGPFRAYGDVVEVSIGEVDVAFNGKNEKRKALYGVFDVTADAKRLNDAGQKVYPSIEIEPNFAGKGFAYLMGCALTDSPAAIATDRLQFNRARPGALQVPGDTAAALEFAEEAAGEDGGNGFLNKLGTLLDGFANKFAAPKPEEKPGTPPADLAATASAFDFAAFRGLLEDMGKNFADSFTALQSEMRTSSDSLEVRLKKLETTQETTPAHSFSRRPPADGNAGNYSGIF